MKCGIREMVFLVLMLALLACSYFFVFKPANEKRAERQAKIEQRKRELAGVKQLMLGIGDAEQKIGELEKAINFFGSRLPQQKEMDKILKQVWQMAEANALETRTVKSLKSEKFAGYSEQSIQMSLCGDFKNGFHAFLRQLESLDRITRVMQMKLDRIDNQDGRVQAQLTLSVFFDPSGDETKLAGAH